MDEQEVSCFSWLILMMESWILVTLITMPGVWSGNWGVILETNKCAVKGATAVINCSYDYPSDNTVTSIMWSEVRYPPWRQRTFHSLPSDRFQYVGDMSHNCSLKINNVQDTDERVYIFSFVTTKDRWTSKSTSRLSVTELATDVQPSTVAEGDRVNISCLSACDTAYALFKDGQPVLKPVTFQARREDAGRYYCAVPGQEAVRSDPVSLNVLFAPKNVTLSVSPSGDIVEGSSVNFTCSSDANPPVAQSGYSLYKDGQFVSSGQSHNISDIQSDHSGLYHCQALNKVNWNDSTSSPEILLDVQYPPTNISVSMDSPQAVEGSSVNLTCSSVANPAADNYTWYKSTESPSSGSGSGSVLQVGSGQVLTLHSVQASDAGLYFCQAWNSVGENNSTGVLLTVTAGHGSQILPVLVGVGVLVVVTLVIVLLFLWVKQRTHEKKEPTVFDSKLSGQGASSLSNEDQPDSVYANINTFPSSPPPAAAAAAAMQDSASHSQRENYGPASDEDEVAYSTVYIKPRNNSRPPHIENSTALQDSESTAAGSDDAVIYATVAKSKDS